MDTFISIDFDFFVWADDTRTMQAKFLDGTTGTVPGARMFDWGHNEGHPASLQEVLWMHRAADWTMKGLDIEALVSIEHAGLDTIDFVQHVCNRLGPIRNVSFADSHAWAFAVAPLALPLGGRVVHFDAHHDMGYNAHALEVQRGNGQADCGSWLYHTVMNGSVSDLTIVYPDWKGYDEWEDMRGCDWIQDAAETRLDHFRVTTWSEWLATELEWNPSDPRDVRPEVTRIFVSRSGTWVPPWLDDQFLDLVKVLLPMPVDGHLCLDCEPERIGYDGQRIGDSDACKHRPWDRDAVLKHYQQLVSLHESRP